MSRFELQLACCGGLRTTEIAPCLTHLALGDGTTTGSPGFIESLGRLAGAVLIVLDCGAKRGEKLGLNGGRSRRRVVVVEGKQEKRGTIGQVGNERTELRSARPPETTGSNSTRRQRESSFKSASQLSGHHLCIQRQRTESFLVPPVTRAHLYIVIERSLRGTSSTGSL